MATVRRIPPRQGRHRHGIQLQQHRVGNPVWLDDLERLAIANRHCRSCYRHHIKHSDHLAREPVGKNNQRPAADETLRFEAFLGVPNSAI